MEGPDRANRETNSNYQDDRDAVSWGNPHMTFIASATTSGCRGRTSADDHAPSPITASYTQELINTPAAASTASAIPTSTSADDITS